MVWRCPANPIEHLKVLACGVHDQYHVRLQEVGQRGKVYLQRVDQDQALLPGHLYQGHLWEVSLLAVEFGIHSDPRLCSQDLQEVGEVVLARDQAVLGGGPPVQADSPASVGKSASTQAVVPPNTFTASRPCPRRNSAAARLRPPRAQMT